MSHAPRGDRERLLRDAVLAGQAWAWTELYDDAYEPLWQYVSWRCGRSRDWTEEVVQQTWLIAVDKVRRFDPGQGTFLGWLRGVADNALRARLRDWARDVRLRRIAGDEPAGGESAEERALRRERALGVAQALAALPSEYEWVLRGKYLDERSVIEMAAELNVTPKTIESRLTRAREAFRKTYQDMTGSNNGSADSPRVHPGTGH